MFWRPFVSWKVDNSARPPSNSNTFVKVNQTTLKSCKLKPIRGMRLEAMDSGTGADSVGTETATEDNEA